MKRTFLLLALLVVAFASCHRPERIPEGVMDEPTMTDFLTEAYLLEGFYMVESRGNVSSLTDEVDSAYTALLQKYHITSAQFDSSISYYSHHLDQYNKIHQEVVQRLDAGTR